MEVQRVSGGIFIPEEYLADFGEIEVIRKRFEIIIKPKTVTRRTVGISQSKLDVWKLHQEYEITMEGETFEAERV